MQYLFCTHSSTDTYLGFTVMTIMNREERNKCLWSRMKYLLSKYSRLVELDLEVDLFPAFWGTTTNFHSDCTSLQSPPMDEYFPYCISFVLFLLVLRWNLKLVLIYISLTMDVKHLNTSQSLEYPLLRILFRSVLYILTGLFVFLLSSFI